MMIMMGRSRFMGIPQSGDLHVSRVKTTPGSLLDSSPGGGTIRDLSASVARKGRFSLLGDANLAESSGVSHTHTHTHEMIQVNNAAAVMLTLQSYVCNAKLLR